MSILNTVMGALGGNAGGSPLMSVVMNMLSGGDGPGNGIGDLLQQLQQGGLGEAAQSWIGSGENASVSAGEITNAFGIDRISEIAQQAGLSVDDVSGQLAQILPQAIDSATPNGEVPSGELDLGSLTSMLGGLLGR